LTLALHRTTLVYTLLTSCFAFGQEAHSAEAKSKIESLPKDLEVHRALIAAPPHLRAGASVYVLDPAKGYVVERQGKNGFTCYVHEPTTHAKSFVTTSLSQSAKTRKEDRTIRNVEFEIERLRIEGKLTPTELKREIDRRFKSGEFHSPSRPGIAYMLSPIARLYHGPGSNETVLMNMPHLMFFAPNLKGEDVGASPPMGPYPYFLSPGPMGYIIVNVGEAEKARINSEERDLLQEACHSRPDLCLKAP